MAEPGAGALAEGLTPPQRFLPLHCPPLLVEALLDGREVGEHEVELEGSERLGGVGVVARAHDGEDGVGVTQRPEQPAPATPAPLSSPREAGGGVGLEPPLDAPPPLC